MSYVMGIRPHAGGITIDPFPFGLERAEIGGVSGAGADSWGADRWRARAGDGGWGTLHTLIGEPVTVGDESSKVR